MENPRSTEDDELPSLRSPYDPEPAEEEDLWFLPGPPEDAAATDMPWAAAVRETGMNVKSWQSAEAAQYQGLVTAAQNVARFGECLRQFSDDVRQRAALSSVAAMLHSEGVWLSAEQIALYIQLRVGSEGHARDLSRADWALRRLNRPEALNNGLHEFLGRVRQDDGAHGYGHATGSELVQLGDCWSGALLEAEELHPITRAAFALAEWQRLEVSPDQDVLEPSVAAMIIGAGQMAPFFPVAQGARLGRGGAPEQRLAGFYEAVSKGTKQAFHQLGRLADWRNRAMRATNDLSGRIPELLIATLVRLPVVSAELVGENAGCSQVSARRNLALFAERGLIRETTGQSRYRYWTVRM
jgi:hypothetical protein